MDAIVSFASASGIYDLMHTKWGWPIVESLHFIGLCFLIGAVGVFDLRMLGLGKGIPYKVLHQLIPFGVAGFILNLVTGLMFFLSAPDQYAYNPAFQTKMMCIALAGINMLCFNTSTLQFLYKTDSLAKVPNRAVFFAMISLLCWTGVIVGGRLITYFRPPYHWCFWC
ncbi:hypothetical protein NBRC116493_13090 [Aurantivibrio infirmus]